MITIYGIKNCDTMKKAIKWLDAHNIDFDFHDYKKLGIDEEILKQAIKDHGWEIVINKRGTTWCHLEQSVKHKMDEMLAVSIAIENPSIVKRPILSQDSKTLVGFDEENYLNLLNG